VTTDTPPVIHASAIVDAGAHIGPGTKIWHFCHVCAGAQIGAGCVLGQNVYVAATAVLGDGVRVQNNVSIYDGVVLDAHVFVGPSAVFTNVERPRVEHPRKGAYAPTRVGRGATIGANATIVCGTTIGRYAFIGAGAVVTRDVSPHALVVGNPARVLGWACTCGERLPEGTPSPCGACGRTFRVESGELIEDRT
jgi:UDP-2-acetamido-3-amino-2,3-dideoxy-glucuronate N-acetyltransferase